MISAVVLASGNDHTTGEQKLFEPFRGKPVLQWVLENALASELDEIVCVTREFESARRHIDLIDERLFWLKNYVADRGKSTSVIAGLWAVNPKSDGVMFLFGDRPFIRKELINLMIERFERKSAWIVAPIFNEKPRNPVLFRRELFPELLQLTGDRDGRALLEKHSEKTALVEWQDEVPFLDLDAREDSERMKKLD